MAAAGTIHVPLDYPFLQAAIDAAENGDVIQLDPGVYGSATITSKTLTLVGWGDPVATNPSETASYIDELAFASSNASLVVRNCVVERLAAAGGMQIQLYRSLVNTATITIFKTALLTSNTASSVDLVDCDEVRLEDSFSGDYGRVIVTNTSLHGTLSVGVNHISELGVSHVVEVTGVLVRGASIDLRNCHSVVLDSCFSSKLIVVDVENMEMAWCGYTGRNAYPDACNYCGLGNFYCRVAGAPCTSAMRVSAVPNLVIIGGFVNGGRGSYSPQPTMCYGMQDYPNCPDIEVSSDSHLTIYSNRPPDEIVVDESSTVEVLPLPQSGWLMR